MEVGTKAVAAIDPHLLVKVGDGAALALRAEIGDLVVVNLLVAGQLLAKITAAPVLLGERDAVAVFDRRHNREALAGADGLTIPFASRTDGSPHIFSILLNDPVERVAFRETLKQAGVQTSVHYPPLHRFSQYWEHYGRQACVSRTGDAAAREVTLPLHPLRERAEVEAIAGAVRQALSAIPVAV